MKKITIVTGHYGSGKTNLSVNLALEIAKTGKKITVVDLDIVNPYFRTADFETLFSENNIEFVKPMYANSNLDIPAISFDLERIARDDGYLIIDVGGDDAGAIALGRYAEAFQPFIDQIEMVYVVNCFRYLTRTSEEAIELLTEIEIAARLKHTAIVNNSNLGGETTSDDINSSMKFAEKISQDSGLPLLFTAYYKGIDGVNPTIKTKPIEIFVKPIWEQQ